MADTGTFNLIRERGIPIMPQIPGLPFTQGNVYHVKPYSGSDSNYGDHPDSAFKTLTQVHTAMTANQNDVALMYNESNTSASTTDYQSTALTWSKDSCHLIGTVAGNPYMGQRARIAQTSTALTVADLVTLSANNCYWSGLEIFQGVSGATASTSRAFVVSGQRNRILSSQIAGIGHLDIDDAASCSLAITGHENYFGKCYIGLDTVLRTTSVSEINITAATRTIIEKCIVMSYTANTSFKAITLAASSAHTATWLIDTVLCAPTNRTGVGVPTGAILHSAAGTVYLIGGGVLGYTNVSTVTNANIIALSFAGAPAHASYPAIGVGVQTT